MPNTPDRRVNSQSHLLTITNFASKPIPYKGKCINIEVKNRPQNKNYIKVPIGFKMMMSTIRVHSFEGKEKENYFFNHISDLSPYRFTQILNVGTHCMRN